MQKPLVTVLMPVYNAEAFVGEAIESILNQTYKDFDFLIIDDGSTDRSAEIVESYDDTRIKFLKNGTNIKLIATLNKGLDIIDTKYIVRMDADDISLPERIEKLVAFMEDNPEYGACSSWVETFDMESSKIVKYQTENDDIRIFSLFQNHFCHGAAIIRTAFIKNHDMFFDKSFPHSEDYIFFVKLAENYKLYCIPNVFLKVRKHTGSVSVQNEEIQKNNAIKVIKYQLEKLGLNSNNIDFNLYFRFFYKSFDLNKKEIEIVENFAIEAIRRNEKSKYLPHEKLTNFICDNWLHLCFNSTVTGFWIYRKFENSELLKCKKIPLSFFLRFIVKIFLAKFVWKKMGFRSIFVL